MLTFMKLYAYVLVMYRLSKVRIMALSATLPNIVDIGQWLGCSQEVPHLYTNENLQLFNNILYICHIVYTLLRRRFPPGAPDVSDPGISGPGQHLPVREEPGREGAGGTADTQ